MNSELAEFDSELAELDSNVSEFDSKLAEFTLKTAANTTTSTNAYFRLGRKGELQNEGAQRFSGALSTISSNARSASVRLKEPDSRSFEPHSKSFDWESVNFVLFS